MHPQGQPDWQTKMFEIAIDPRTEVDFHLKTHSLVAADMILSEKMVDTLHEIRRIETNKISRILNVPATELGNCLIKLYYSTSRLETRTLIAEFMHHAGVVWMRKLLTRDTAPIASTQTKFATLNDYVELMAANDEQLFADQLAY